jgi:C_GCAxxG_C_C family probable redox protein
LLLEYVKKYYNKEFNFNCAETIMYAANHAYSLNLDKNTLRTMSAFGGGMSIGDTCGAITGALAVIGIIFTKQKSHESDTIKKLTIEFFNKFNGALGAKNCTELKGKYFNSEERCSKMLYASAEILEQLIKEYRVD